ncbi:MAG: hypothetical protein IJS46_02745, partial [Kiritimatiellae bacterium]|nr:hypothetical protein [Kiritimatiellia bacterium]
PLVVSEFNWPIAGTGEWSPVGSPYVSPGVRSGDPSVPEDDAAAFAVRWFLLGVCSGHAESMCFWSLAAHGFGLVDPGTAPGAAWRPRPAFEALKFLFAFLRGCDYISAPVRGGAGGAWALVFRAQDGTRKAIAWKAGSGTAPAPDAETLGFTPSCAFSAASKPFPADAPIDGHPRFYA